MLFFHNIASWCVANRRVGSIADSRRRHSLSGAGLEPCGPVAPPAAVVFFALGPPRRRRPGRRRIAGLVDPVAAFSSDGGLMMPAMWPLEAITKRTLPLVAG